MIASPARRYAAELLGTFALVVVGPGAAMVAARTQAFGNAAVAAAFGLAVTFIVAASGHLGGAHINPAVTIGFWSAGRFPGRDVAPYVAAQCAGAIAASALLGWLLGASGGFGTTIPAVPLAQAFVIEAGFTGMLAFVIMGVATDARTSRVIAPFVSGATVAAGALVTGPLAGGSFNPARTLGPALLQGAWTAHWLYWLAPVSGAMLGMRLYDAVRNDRAGGVPIGTEGLLDDG